MQGMAISGSYAALAPTHLNTVTVIPSSVVVDPDLKAAVLRSLDIDNVHPTTVTIVNEPRRSVLCSFADAATARRANDILRQTMASVPATTHLNITHPSDPSGGGGARRRGRQPFMDLSRIQICIPGNPKKYIAYHDPATQAATDSAGAAAATAQLAGEAAAVAAEPAPLRPAEPAGSSQVGRLGYSRPHTALLSTADSQPPRHRGHRETAPEPRRGAGQRSSGDRRPTSRGSRVCRRDLESRLRAVRPYASNCHLKAPQRQAAEQPGSGLDEMYIGQQHGHACFVRNVGNLTFSMMLFDSLAGARIFRAAAALLHIKLCPPPEISIVFGRLTCCFEALLPFRLRDMLVDDCRAFLGRRHASVGRSGIEKYLMEVVHPMLATR